MVSTNGHANGHHNGSTHRLHDSEALNALISELAREVTSFDKAIVLKSGESGVPYVDRYHDAIKNFVRDAKSAINELDAKIQQRAPQRDDLRRDVEQARRALAEIDNIGSAMERSGEAFVSDLFSTAKRSDASSTARALLEAITRFMLMIDRFDVFLIIQAIDLAKSLLDDMRRSRTVEEVRERYETFLTVIQEIDETSRIRQAELASAIQREDLMAARELVKTSCPLVYSTTKAAIRHPTREHAEMMEAAHDELRRALEGMQSAIEGGQVESGFASSDLRHYGRLASALEHFQTRLMSMDPKTYQPMIDRPHLEEELERIVTGSAAIADEQSTRRERKDKIILECNSVRQALQELLAEYDRNKGSADASYAAELAMVNIEKRMRDLKRHLRRAIIDNVGDAYLDVHTPLALLIEAARSGDKEETQVKAAAFLEHSRRIIHVARLACEMSTDQTGIRHIKYATELLERLAPQVVRGAELLCIHPESPEANEHMEMLKEIWVQKVLGLTMVVDKLLSIDDFLAVSESHIVEDAKAAMHAVSESNALDLDSRCGAIRGRCLRVASAVDEEMACLGSESYGEKVKTAVRKLRDEVGSFSHNAEHLINRVESNRDMSEEEKSREVEELAGSCNGVLECVKDIRNALIVNRNVEDVDSDNEYEDEGVTIVDNRSTISDGDKTKHNLRHLPEQDKAKIQEQIDIFKVTQSRFEREVAKWEDTENDIIVLARYMCTIMANMTDFTRGRGPYKSTMHVISAAQEISTAGQKLSVLARQIGDEAEESNASNMHLRKTKEDLVAYLDKMTLFCQQLNICSRVKADVVQVGDEVVVSGLESAMSLIQTAKNLLSAVVSTVKNAYIISTKFRSNTAAPRVEWKMTRPRKQPLVSAQAYATQRSHGIVRRASEKRPMPMTTLAEFTRP